jgi:hypothetical protein
MANIEMDTKYRIIEELKQLLVVFDEVCGNILICDFGREKIPEL